MIIQIPVNYGQNFVGIPFDTSGLSIVDIFGNDSDIYNGIIGRGQATTLLPNGTWVGSLININPTNMYYINIKSNAPLQNNTDLDTNFDKPYLLAINVNDFIGYNTPYEIPSNYLSSPTWHSSILNFNDTEDPLNYFEDLCQKGYIDGVLGEGVASTCINGVLLGSLVNVPITTFTGFQIDWKSQPLTYPDGTSIDLNNFYWSEYLNFTTDDITAEIGDVPIDNVPPPLPQTAATCDCIHEDHTGVERLLKWDGTTFQIDEDNGHRGEKVGTSGGGGTWMPGDNQSRRVECRDGFTVTYYCIDGNEGQPPTSSIPGCEICYEENLWTTYLGQNVCFPYHHVDIENPLTNYGISANDICNGNLASQKCDFCTNYSFINNIPGYENYGVADLCDFDNPTGINANAFRRITANCRLSTDDFFNYNGFFALPRVQDIGIDAPAGYGFIAGQGAQDTIDNSARQFCIERGFTGFESYDVDTIGAFFTYYYNENTSEWTIVNPPQSPAPMINLQCSIDNNAPIANTPFNVSVFEDSQYDNGYPNAFGRDTYFPDTAGAPSSPYLGNHLCQDPDWQSGDSNTVSIVAGPSNGTAEIITDTYNITQAFLDLPAQTNNYDFIAYTPNPNFDGNDQIYFVCTDEDGNTSNTGIINISVLGVNDPPIVIPFTVSVDEDTQTTFFIPGEDPDGSIAAYEIRYSGGAIPPNGGLIQLDGQTYTEEMRNNNTWLTSTSSGQVTYRASTNYYGSDSIEFRVRDDDYGYSTIENINIIVNPINDAPILQNLPSIITLQEDSSTTVTIEVGSGGHNNTPDLNDNVTLQAFLTATATNIEPFLSVNIEDEYGNNPRYFELIISATSNVFGNATLTLLATDSGGLTASEQIPVNILGVNDQVNAPDYNVSVNEDGAIDIHVECEDPDAPSGLIQYFPITEHLPTFGTITEINGVSMEYIEANPSDFSWALSSAGTTFRYVPNPNFNGQDSFKYQCYDGEVETGIVGSIGTGWYTGTTDIGTVNITITPVNDSINARNVTVNVDEDSTIAIGLDTQSYPSAGPFNGNHLCQDVDWANGGVDAEYTMTIDFPPANGTAEVIEAEYPIFWIMDPGNDGLDGAATATYYYIQYTPNPNFNGQETFSYTCYNSTENDPFAPSSFFNDTGYITVNVVAVNDAPTINAISNQTIDEDQTIDITIQASDIDEDTLTYAAETDSDEVSVSFSGNVLTLTPDENYNGSTIVTVTVSDGNLSATTSFTLTVNPINDVPDVSKLKLANYTPNDTNVILDNSTRTITLYEDKITNNITFFPLPRVYDIGINASGNGYLSVVNSTGDENAKQFCIALGFSDFTSYENSTTGMINNYYYNSTNSTWVGSPYNAGAGGYIINLQCDDDNPNGRLFYIEHEDVTSSAGDYELITEEITANLELLNEIDVESNWDDLTIEVSTDNTGLEATFVNTGEDERATQPYILLSTTENFNNETGVTLTINVDDGEDNDDLVYTVKILPTPDAPSFFNVLDGNDFKRYPLVDDGINFEDGFKLNLLDAEGNVVIDSEVDEIGCEGVDEITYLYFKYIGVGTLKFFGVQHDESNTHMFLVNPNHSTYGMGYYYDHYTTIDVSTLTNVQTLSESTQPYSIKLQIEYNPPPFYAGTEYMEFGCGSGAIPIDIDSTTGDILDTNGNIVDVEHDVSGFQYLVNVAHQVIYYDNTNTPTFENVPKLYFKTKYREFTSDFGYDDTSITIEQSIYKSHNPMSGLSVLTNNLQNTEQSIDLNDFDKRPSLGMFYYDDNNPLRNNFVENLNTPFTQLEKTNLIPNGAGRFTLYSKDDSTNNPFASGYTDTYIPKGWNYINMTGVKNVNNSTYASRFTQDSNADENANMFAGYEDYTVPSFTNLEDGSLKWARWVESSECYSYDKCLYLDNTGTSTSDSYKTLNQYATINKENILPFSSIKVSFWMKTIQQDTNGMPEIEVAINNLGGIPGRHYNIGVYRDNSETLEDENHNDYIAIAGNYNSLQETDITTYWDYFGAAGRFKNTSMDVWEKMEYTFNLTSQNVLPGTQNIKLLYLLINWGNDLSGKVYLDNFSVTEAYDFIPDVDTRVKKGNNNYSDAILTQYYDSNITNQVDKYKDTIAPLEASFYFYPRYNRNLVFDLKSEIIYNDFRAGLFYIYDIDWGDDTPKEFTSKPEQLGNNKMIYHTYENSGIYEITGTILRLKPDLNLKPIGVMFNQRFTLRINVNEGLDEDFTYFGANGFSFIPYKNTLPIVGGYNEQSIYYKSIKRQLGFIEDNTNVITNYERLSDKLKTEIALQKMDSDFEFNLLPIFNQIRFAEAPEYLFTLADNEITTNPTNGNISLSTQGWYIERDNQSRLIINESFTPTQYQDGTFGVNVRFEISRADNYYYEDSAGNEVYGGDSWLFIGYNARQYDNLLETFANGGTEFTMRFDIKFNELTDNGPYLSYRHANTSNDWWQNSQISKGFNQVRGNFNHTSVIPNNINDGSPWIPIEMKRKLVSDYQRTYTPTSGDNAGVEQVQNFNGYAGLEFLTSNLNMSNNTTGNPGTTTNWDTEPIVIDFDLRNVIVAPTSDYDTYEASLQTEDTGTIVNTGKMYDDFKEELGSSIGDVDITNIRYFNEPKSIWEMFGFEEEDLEQIGNPNTSRYWKNIIPKDYSIFNRQGIPLSIYGVATGGSYDENITIELNQNQIGYNSGEILFNVNEEFDFIHPNGNVFTIDLTSHNDGNYGVVISILNDINQPNVSTTTDDKEAYLMFVGSDETRFNMYPGGGDGWQKQIIVAYYDNGVWIYDDNISAYDSTNNQFTPNENDCILARVFANEGDSGISDIIEFVNNDNFLTVNINSEQDWINQYYYPVLPKYGQNGRFVNIETDNEGNVIGGYPMINGEFKKPFALSGLINIEEPNEKSLKINITSEQIENNVLDDLSGNQNNGYAISDYKPNFDNQTLEPKKIKNTDRIRSSKTNGAF